MSAGLAAVGSAAAGLSAEPVRSGGHKARDSAALVQRRAIEQVVLMESGISGWDADPDDNVVSM